MTMMLDILLSTVYLAVGTALFAVAVVLAVLFHYRITPRIPRIQRNNNWFPPPTNKPCPPTAATTGTLLPTHTAATPSSQ